MKNKDMTTHSNLNDKIDMKKVLEVADKLLYKDKCENAEDVLKKALSQGITLCPSGYLDRAILIFPENWLGEVND